MTDEELIHYISNLVKITEKSNEDEIEAEVELSVEMTKQLLNLIEKQEKMIDEMINFIFDLRDCPMEDCEFDCDCENRCNNENETVKECWRIYFEKKASE